MVKIAVAQADFKVGQRETNLGLIRALLEQAEQAAAEILVLPELANSGYNFENQQEAEAMAENIPDGAVCKLLQAWSNPNRLVVSGLCEKKGQKLYNSAVIFSQGKLESTYRKVHLFGSEKNFFQAGDDLPPVIPFRQSRLGIMICFDWFFPEMARTLALNGAQIILHPSNLVLPYCQKAMLTRSIENRVFTATANRYGEERGLCFSGLSQITSPKGDVLVQTGSDQFGVTCAEVDLSAADNKWVTAQNHLFQDRRPEFYQRITELPDNK